MTSFSLGGDPASIRASASLWGTFGTAAGSASTDIKGVDSSEFAGDEGESFRAKVNDDLPPHLDTTSEAWGIVSAALNAYAGKLESFQSRLSTLKTQHDNQQSKVSSAQTSLANAQASDRAETSRVTTARLALKPGETLPASTYVSTTSGARTSYTEAAADLQGTIDAANQVWSDHREAVTACCHEISRAKGMRFEKPPGFWGRLKNSVVDWVKENADVLRQISGVLKIISAIAGVLSLVPGLNVIMGPLALITGGAALLIDVGLKLATGEGSWSSIIIDAATMALPGVGKIVGKGLKVAVGAEKVATTSYRVRSAVTGSKIVTGLKASKAYKGMIKANDAVYSTVNKVPIMKTLNNRAAAKAIERVRTNGIPVDTAQAIVNRRPGIIAETRANPRVTRPTPRTPTRAKAAAMNNRTANGSLECVESGRIIPPRLDAHGTPIKVDPATGRRSATGQTMPVTAPSHPNSGSIGHKPGHDYSASQVVHTYDDASRAAVRNDYNDMSHYHGYEHAGHNSGKSQQSYLSTYENNRSPVFDTTSPFHAVGGLIRLGND